MPQMSLASSGFERHPKQTRKRIFLVEMNRVVPWPELVALITPHAPAVPGAKGGRPPFAVETMLRIHFLQQWFALSDPAMEEALHDTPLFREFARLDIGQERMPDESTVLRFRHLLEEHGLAAQMFERINALLAAKGLMLKEGTAIDATIIAAPSSTKNKDDKGDPEMHQTKKGNQWHFGMKAHIGVDADSGLVHTVTTTAANAHDVTQAHKLLHGKETDVFADSGFRGVDKRQEVQDRHSNVNWHVGMMPSKRRALDKSTESGARTDELEQLKAAIRAKVGIPFGWSSASSVTSKPGTRGPQRTRASCTYSLCWPICGWRERGCCGHECVRNRAKGRKLDEKPATATTETSQSHDFFGSCYKTPQ